MAITLYKPGITHTVKGVKCIAKNFEVKHLKAAKHAGWFTDPTEMKPKPGRKPADPLPNQEPIAGNVDVAENRHS